MAAPEDQFCQLKPMPPIIRRGDFGTPRRETRGGFPPRIGYGRAGSVFRSRTLWVPELFGVILPPLIGAGLLQGLRTSV